MSVSSIVVHPEFRQANIIAMPQDPYFNDSMAA